MDITTLLAVYVLGFLTGAISLIIVTIAIAKRSFNKRKKELETGKKPESVGARLKQVKDITTEQLDLQGQISGPQKNGLHGRHKNGLVARLKELESQKTEILKSIVADGFDPEITVMDETGVVTNIKLSEFLAQNGVVMPPVVPKPEAPKVPAGPPPAPKQHGRFMVHKGGKDDGSGTTH